MVAFADPPNSRYLSTEDEQWAENFQAWFAFVCLLLNFFFKVNQSKLNIDDLPDQPYIEWFDQGLTPDQAAIKTLQEIGVLSVQS